MLNKLKICPAIKRTCIFDRCMFFVPDKQSTAPFVDKVVPQEGLCYYIEIGKAAMAKGEGDGAR